MKKKPKTYPHSSDNNYKRISTISKMLGIAGKPGKGISKVAYDDGFGPTLTLLDVNFSNAPGYVIVPEGEKNKEEEPSRNKGDIHVNNFPSLGKVVSVPYYMLAEQVAQLMRFVNLPMEFVVSLEPAKPKNGTKKPEKTDLFYMTSRGEKAPTGNLKKSLAERENEIITMLPLHNDELSKQQELRRALNTTDRPQAHREEAVPMLESSEENDKSEENGEHGENNNNYEKSGPAKKQKREELDINGGGEYQLSQDPDILGGASSSETFVIDDDDNPLGIPQQELTDWYCDIDENDPFDFFGGQNNY